MKAASFIRPIALGTLLLATWSIHVYHLGAFREPPGLPPAGQFVAAKAQFIPHGTSGINQLILAGGDYARGLAAGQATRALLREEEKELSSRLDEIIPRRWELQALAIPLLRWFWGIDAYMEPWVRQEMYGVGKSAPPEFDYLADGYSRQVYYHGVHEVGQMMVDRGAVSDAATGCTLAAFPSEGKWVIGRNFDFEGGRVFDEEKIMKWVFPEKGHAFLSLIWAGMVGAVTGVNDRGLYISLNAAGSDDFARYGTPSTLIVLKALQFADSIDDAIRIIVDTPMFITDIFVVSDRATGALFRIEKSPRRAIVTRLTQPSLIVNHLVSGAWAQDRTNLLRRDELTSGERARRGQALLDAIPAGTPAADVDRAVAAIMRDKGESGGHALHLGNRGAIDALIATHGVIYDEPAGILFVNRGPGVSGKYLGFDLARSFAARAPVRAGELPEDSRVSPETFRRVKEAERFSARAAREAAKSRCPEAAQALARARDLFAESNAFSAAEGDYQSNCEHDVVRAKRSWGRALARHVPYLKERLTLEDKVSEAGASADQKAGDP